MIWRAVNRKQMYEPITKRMKKNKLKSAAESSYPHNFLVYLAKHL